MRDALSVPQYVELYPEVPPHMLPEYPRLAPDRMMVPIVRGGNLCCPYPGGFALASVWDVSLWEGRLWPIPNRAFALRVFDYDDGSIRAEGTWGEISALWKLVTGCGDLHERDWEDLGFRWE